MRLVLGLVVERGVQLEQRHLPVARTLRVRRGNQLPQPEAGEVGREVFSEVRSFRVVARQQNRLAPEHVGVVFHVGVHLRLDITVLGVELVILRTSSCAQTRIIRHYFPDCNNPVL